MDTGPGRPDTEVAMETPTEGATMIPLDTTTRAARMLSAGRLTVTFRSPSGTHITLTAKCRAPNDATGKWEGSTLAAAKVIFIEVPNPEGWNDKVGKVTRSKGFTPDPNTDEARAYCARMLLRYVAGESLPPSLEVHEEERCGKCGRQLTDPVSIERGIGPECYGAATGSRHETKADKVAATEPVPSPEVRKEIDAEYGGKSILNPNPTPRRTPADEITGDEHGAFEGNGYPAPSPRDADYNERMAARKVATDKKGVALGVGDWRARKNFLNEELRRENEPRGKQAKDATPAACSQLSTLPGETWEDIFGGTAAIEAKAAAHAETVAAKLAAR